MGLKAVLVALVVVVCALAVAQARRGPPTPPRRPPPTAPRRNRGQNKICDTAVSRNISALWDKYEDIRRPIELYVHSSSQRGCSDYFGCGHSHSHHSQHSHYSHHGNHSHHSHSHHSHKHHSHKHHSHKHHSHKHHSHKHHGSHPSHHGHHKHSHKTGVGHHSHHSHLSHHGHHGHQSHHSHSHHGHRRREDSRIHIYLSLDKGGPTRPAYPKNKFVYAKCEMKKEGNHKVRGNIYMRQKPHKELDTKIRMRSFPRASQGAKDGAHDFFFDLHEYADFSQGCQSFGKHDHVHHDHSKNDTHSHSHHHHHHEHPDDWGNIIVNNRGVAKMDVNTTIHTLFGPKSIFGRGLVLHDENDHIMSCCAITYANLNETSWMDL